MNRVRLDPVSPDELAQRVAGFVECGHSHIVRFCAAHPTVLARHDEAYRELLNRGDLTVPDGQPVAWALRLFGCPAERLAGSDAMAFLCEWGVAIGLRHYLYGGTPEVAGQLGETLARRYPGIQVVGVESPPFRELTDAEWHATAERIRAARADCVWIGLGAPKQDWAAERLASADARAVLLCVGAAFDFVAGAKQRAPRWMQNSGLEWLHRLLREPRRLGGRYLRGNASFVIGVVRDSLANGRTRSL